MGGRPIGHWAVAHLYADTHQLLRQLDTGDTETALATLHRMRAALNATEQQLWDARKEAQEEHQ